MRFLLDRLAAFVATPAGDQAFREAFALIAFVLIVLALGALT